MINFMMTDKQQIITLMQSHGFYERATETIQDGVSTYAVRWIKASDGSEGPLAESSDEVDAYMQAAILAINAFINTKPTSP